MSSSMIAHSEVSLVDPPSLIGGGLKPIIVDVMVVPSEVIVVTTVTSEGALVTVCPALLVVVTSITDVKVVLQM